MSLLQILPNMRVLQSPHLVEKEFPITFLDFVFSFCTSVCVCAQSCPTLCNPIDSSPPGSSVHGIFLERITRVGCHALLQGIFLTQGSNLGFLGLLHFRWILYLLSHWRSPLRVYWYKLQMLSRQKRLQCFICPSEFLSSVRYWFINSLLL